jgi:hypothetical protein
MAVALLALFVALGGSSYAALRIGTRQIKNNSIRSVDIKNRTVRGRDIHRRTVRRANVARRTLFGINLARDRVTGAEIDEPSLGTVPSANRAGFASRAGTVDKLRTVGSRKVVSSSAASQAGARQELLFSQGAFDLYLKCYITGGATHADVFIRTRVNGAVFDSGSTALKGTAPGGFLNTSTAEPSRTVNTISSGGTNTTGISGAAGGVFSASAPDGSGISGHVGIAAKNGTLPGGNGVYGSGNRCVATGFIAG